MEPLFPVFWAPSTICGGATPLSSCRSHCDAGRRDKGAVSALTSAQWSGDGDTNQNPAPSLGGLISPSSYLHASMSHPTHPERFSRTARNGDTSAMLQTTCSHLDVPRHRVGTCFLRRQGGGVLQNLTLPDDNACGIPLSDLANGVQLAPSSPCYNVMGCRYIYLVSSPVRSLPLLCLAVQSICFLLLLRISPECLRRGVHSPILPYKLFSLPFETFIPI